MAHLVIFQLINDRGFSQLTTWNVLKHVAESCALWQTCWWWFASYNFSLRMITWSTVNQGTSEINIYTSLFTK